MLGGLLIKGFERFDFVPLAIPVLLVWSFYITRLDTRIDAAGIHYRFFPLMRWRHIPWSKIRRVAVQTYPFVGYGIRWDFECWYYNVAGQQGFRVDRTKGGPIVIGTQRPDQLRQFLADIRPAVQA